MSEPDEFYPCSFRLHDRKSYLIWISNVHDGILLNSDKNVIVFASLSALESYAKTQKISLNSSDNSDLDFDALQRWLLIPDADKVDCSLLLNAWNLFDDLNRSIIGVVIQTNQVLEKIYDKLFWGNNLAPVTPEGEHYEPIWEKTEIDLLANFLKHGLDQFKQCLKFQE